MLNSGKKFLNETKNHNPPPPPPLPLQVKWSVSNPNLNPILGHNFIALHRTLFYVAISIKYYRMFSWQVEF